MVESPEPSSIPGQPTRPAHWSKPKEWASGKAPVCPRQTTLIWPGSTRGQLLPWTLRLRGCPSDFRGGHSDPLPVIPNRREESKIHRPQPVGPWTCRRKHPPTTTKRPGPTAQGTAFRENLKGTPTPAPGCGRATAKSVFRHYKQSDQFLFCS